MDTKCVCITKQGKSCKGKHVHDMEVLTKNGSAVWSHDLDKSAKNMVGWFLKTIRVCNAHTKSFKAGKEVKVQYLDSPKPSMVRPERKDFSSGKEYVAAMRRYATEVQGRPTRRVDTKPYFFYPKNRQAEAVAMAKQLKTSMKPTRNGLGFIVMKPES